MNNVLKHNGTRHAFWAKADCGNFGSLLRGMGHCSTAQSRSQWKMRKQVGSSGRQWKGQKLCGSKWKIRKGQEGVRKGQERSGRSGRGGKAREGNTMLQYLSLKAKPSRPKCCAVINKVGRSWSLVPTHTSPSCQGRWRPRNQVDIKLRYL